MGPRNIKVGTIKDVSGELNIAAGDIYKGYTEAEVSQLLTKISSTFQPKPFDGRCPYKGLDVFEEEDAELFFGREALVVELTQRIKGSRTIFITGPSGSGKSSLVRAGLTHTLRSGAIAESHSENWLYESIKPGRDPLEALALVFSRLKSPDLADYFRTHVGGTSILNACAESVLKDRADQRFVLFIDQFEEVFTQVSKEDVRATFLNVLTDAIRVENGRVIVLFAMRSDFVSNCATYPELNALLNQQFIQIGSMQPKELVSAIAEPALRVGLRIDPDLISQIINDMEGEPGTLPLMQFALKDLFTAEQAKGGMIAFTRVAYHERGGIYKSLERHADDAFTKLSESEQRLAYSIFSSLIEIGHGAADTSRTALFDELVPANARASDVAAIVQKLSDARLITTDEQSGRDMITISHEKLIDAWPWLKKLVNENRDVIALQNEIAEDAKEWEEQQRDPSYLYRGARLSNAREKLSAKKLVLSELSQSFLDAGIRASQDELEAAKQTAVRFRRLASYLLVALVTALVAVGVAISSRNQARQQTQIAFTRQLAAQAMVIQDDKRDLAMLMSIQAYKTHHDLETESSLLSTVQCCSDALIAFLPGHKDSVWDVAFSPDGKMIASGGNDGSILIWDVQSRKQIHSVTRETSATIYTLAFSPTDPILAAGDGTGSITLYNTQTWKPIAAPLRGHQSIVLSIKFSKDGKLLVSGGADGKVLVWRVATLKILNTFFGRSNWVWGVAISADNKTIASVGRGNPQNKNSLFLWSLDSNKFVHYVGVPKGTLVSVAFNDDRQSPLLLTGDAGGNVIVWDLKPWQQSYKTPLPSNRLPTGSGADDVVWGLAFVPGHPLDFISGRDHGILNRNLIVLQKDFSKVTLQRESLGLTGNNFGVFRIAVSPDGQLIAAGGQDGLVSLWHATEMPSVIRHTDKIKSLQISEGTAKLAMSIDANGKFYRWDYSQQKILGKITLDTGHILKSAISPDGSLIVTGYDNGMLGTWNSQSGKKLAEYSEHMAQITSLVFSGDGKYLASSDSTGHVILWNVMADHQLRTSANFTDPNGSAIQTLLFSRDGKQVFGAGCGYPIPFPSPDCGQGLIYVWNDRLENQFTLPGMSGFALSLALNPVNPDELAVGTRDGTITIWNLSSKKTRLSLKLGKSDITALAFQPTDGTLLAVAADGYKVYLYNTVSGQKMGQSFRDHDGPVTALVFSVDGKTLLSASTDNTIVIHDMNPEGWQEHACRAANHNFSRDQWQTYIGNAVPYGAICPEFPIEIETTPTP